METRNWLFDFPPDIRIPCRDAPGVFERANIDLSCRIKAARICRTCPRTKECLEGAKRGKEQGVWGGKFSVNGSDWISPIPDRSEGFLSELRRIGRRGRSVRVLDTCSTLVPGLRDFFRDEYGVLKYKAVGACLLRESRWEMLPNGEYGSARKYLLTTVVPSTPPRPYGGIEATCETEECISPWHLLWIGQRRGSINQCTASCLYLALGKGLSPEAAKDLSPYRASYIRRVTAIGRAIPPQLELPPPENLESINERLGLQGIEAVRILQRILQTASGYDCRTIVDLIDIGRGEMQREASK